MIKIIDISHDDLYALEIEGKIDKADYDKVLPLMVQMIKKHDKIRIYLEVKEIDRMSAQAIWQEVKADLKYLDHFSKVAVVGDAAWKQMLTYGVSLFPHIEAKYFEFSQREEARQWINDKRNN